MRFNLIGAGRLGKQWGYVLLQNGLGQLQGVYNQRLQSAESVVQQLGMGQAVTSLNTLPPAEITFITVPDDCIVEITNALLSAKVLSAGNVVVHCSGVLSAEVLAPLRATGCYVASVHPLKAFTNQQGDKNIFHDCDIVIEGDGFALKQVTSLLAPLAARFITIASGNKSLYHAACVMASNYLVTLAAESVALLHQAGIEPELAQAMTLRLMQNNLDNISQKKSPAEALTGPIARGDLATIQLHLKAIKSPLTQALYRAAGLATVPLAATDEAHKQAIKAVLEQ